jgi:LPS sulfotransferase NodH
VLRPELPEDSVEPVRSIVLCGTQRSGTWLLCGLLDSTGVAGHPHEWFSAGTAAPARMRWGTEDDASYVRAVRRAGTTPNGVFAVKVMWSDVAQLPTLPAPTYVWLRRDDHIAQAVSWALAGQTGVYHAWDPPRGTASHYDASLIGAFVGLIEEHERGWAGWFAERSIDPLVLRYEDLLADPEGETRRLMRAFGVGDPRRVAVQTERRGNGLAEEWAQRYRERLPA